MKYLSKADPRELKGTAILRLDFNTEGEWRMERAIPTINFLLKRADKVVIVSHRGRPEGGRIEKGIPRGFDKNLSLGKDVRALEKFLKCKIVFIPHFDFQKISTIIKTSPARTVFLLENLRFLPGEGTDSVSLAEKIARLGDFYVNDAFAVSHRKAASLSAITKFLPSYAGLELEKEILNLSKIIRNPKKPLVFVLGGAKAKDKLGVIRYFKKRADNFLLGGACANTLLSLRGIEVGSSLKDEDVSDLAGLREVSRYKNIILPLSWRMERNAIFDLGEDAIKEYTAKIKKAGTIIWSGPLGLIEKKKFSVGTSEIAKAIVKNRRAFKVVGGGETVMFLKENGLDKKFDFISTGGGAMLDFLAGEKLPGIEALKKNKK